jgi:hypothetical protein
MSGTCLTWLDELAVNNQEFGSRQNPIFLGRDGERRADEDRQQQWTCG